MERGSRKDGHMPTVHWCGCGYVGVAVGVAERVWVWLCGCGCVGVAVLVWLWVKYTCLFSVLDGCHSYILELRLGGLVHEPQIIVAVADEHLSVLSEVVAKQ